LYSTTSSFAQQRFSINPGLFATYPWLCRSAINYEQFQLEGFMAVFESEASEYTNTIGMGYVAAGSQYDVLEAPFSSKKQMFQSEFTVARKPSMSFAHWIECDPNMGTTRTKFIRGSAAPAGADLHMYDHCNVTVATGGHSVSGVIIGELWFTYDVSLILPRSDETTALTNLYSGFNSTGTVNSTFVFGSNPAAQQAQNTFGCSIQPQSVTFPNTITGGQFQVLVFWTGTSGVPYSYVYPTMTTTNAAIVGPTLLGIGAASSTGGPTGMGAFFYFYPSGPGASFTLASGTWVGPAGATAEVTMVQLPNALESVPKNHFFDLGGKERDTRYDAIMARLADDSTKKNGPLRAAEDVELSVDDEGPFLMVGDKGQIRLPEHSLHTWENLTREEFVLAGRGMACIDSRRPRER